MDAIPFDIRIELVRNFCLLPRSQDERQALVDEIAKLKACADAEYIEAESQLARDSTVLAEHCDIGNSYSVDDERRAFSLSEFERAKNSYEYYCNLECMVFRANGFESCYTSSERNRLARVYQGRDITGVSDGYYRVLASNLIYIGTEGRKLIEEEVSERDRLQGFCDEDGPIPPDGVDPDSYYEERNELLDEIEALTESINLTLSQQRYLWEAFVDMISRKKLRHYFPVELVDVVIGNRKEELYRVLEKAKEIH